LYVSLFLVAVLITGACNRVSPETNVPDVPATPYFRDLTAESGVDAMYRNGEEAGRYAILETLGGGVALLDYDGDGLLDIFITGGGFFDRDEIRGRPCKLFKNLGGFRFKDVTAEAGLDKPLFYTHGCAVADYDRDGWPDLLVTGFGQVALFHNEPDGKGGRHFVNVTKEAGLNEPQWNTSSAWADLDGDGWPDLYICRYVDWALTTNNPECIGFDGKRRDICPPGRFTALPHRLYRNSGNGTFTEVGKAAGLRVEDPDKNYGRGLGVLAVDVDGDGRPDLYVANDQSDKFLYLNHSRPGTIKLEEVGLQTGVARDDQGAQNGSMGLAAADYDDCGRPSLWVTNYEGELHGLYHNDSRAGRLHFRFRTQASGIGSLGRSFVGWGTGFFDLDNDGREHLFFVNGHPNYYPRAGGPRAQHPVLLRNVGQGRFEDIAAQGGSYFLGIHNGRGVAFGDLDNDGRTDLVISHVNEPVVLLRNESATAYHWLGVELRGRNHRDIVGARLTLEVAGRRLTRFSQGGGSYLSSSDRRIIFGLADADRVGRLTVTWPWGKEEHWEGLEIDKYHRIVEGTGS
jgi:hypothetical protein